MSYRIASWNIRDGFLRRRMRDNIAKLNADVVILPEAYRADEHGTMMVSDAGSQSDYETHYVSYDDVDGREDRHVLAVMVRRELEARVSTVRTDRSFLAVRLDDLLIVAVHLDDRREVVRLRQLRKVLQLVADEPAVVIAGDFNAAPDGTRLTRVVAPVARLWRGLSLPIGEPGTRQSPLARVGSLATRLDAMLDSRVLTELERHGYQDADSRHQPTFKAASIIPLVSLDHIVSRGQVRTVSYRRPRLQGSDHLPIVADVYVH